MSQPQSPLPGAMPGRIPEGVPPPKDFDPVAVAKNLLRTTRAGTLATLDRNTGYPFASLVNVATDVDGSPVILISRFATHTANLEQDARASVMLAASGKGDPLAHPRLTVLGEFRKQDNDLHLSRRFLARHPKSELYAGFTDFAYWRMTMVSTHLNGGFARAANLTAEQVFTDLSGAQPLLDAAERLVDHINADHADAVALYATNLLGAADGAWRVTGLDPEGVDLSLGDATLRLPFPHRVADPVALRNVLKELADRARSLR